MHHMVAVALAAGELQRSRFIELGGIMALYVAGVRLYIDSQSEESWIEMEPGYDFDVLRSMEAAVNQLGYEFMVEVGSIEEFDDGRIRNYLAQTWFPEEQHGDGVVREELIVAS